MKSLKIFCGKQIKKVENRLLEKEARNGYNDPYCHYLDGRIAAYHEILLKIHAIEFEKARKNKGF